MKLERLTLTLYRGTLGEWEVLAETRLQVIAELLALYFFGVYELPNTVIYKKGFRYSLQKINYLG